jgi:hypothetical protein
LSIKLFSIEFLNFSLIFFNSFLYSSIFSFTNFINLSYKLDISFAISTPFFCGSENESILFI